MDATLNWMFANLPPSDWTLENYVAINWCGDLSVEDVLADAELTSELPEELYPVPATKVRQ